MKIQQSLSLILPVYKEKDLLSRSLEKLNINLENNFEDHEILIIDDGNPDEDKRIISSLSAKYPKTKVITNNVNMNIGISLKKGMENAEKDLILFNSADLPLSPADIPIIVQNLDNNDFLVIQREIYAGATTWRKVASRINLILLKTLFPVLGKGIKDFNYTFLFKKDIYAKIKPDSNSPAFTQAELILNARLNKLNIAVCQADYHARTSGKGSLGKPKDIIWTLSDIFKYRWRTWIKSVRSS